MAIALDNALLNADLESRVAARTADLEAANQELEAFSYSVSHDLQTPLRIIEGFIHVLLEEHKSSMNEKVLHICNRINENARHMATLISELLNLSRLGRMEMRQTHINMEDLAETVFHELTTPESRRRIDFQLGKLPIMVGDPTCFRQIWANLLSNAIKYSAKRERATIEVNAELKAEEVVYSVRDNGEGFDMTYISRLFGVFQRLHSAQEFEGDGVGLAIVKRLVMRHGGRVWAEGEKGKGAVFYFTIPWKRT